MDKKNSNAICDECKQECWVPFKPKPGLPVYCKPCYKKRKMENIGSELPEIKRDNTPASVEDIEERIEDIEKLEEEIKEEKEESQSEILGEEDRETAEELIEDGITGEPTNPEEIGIFNPEEEKGHYPKYDYNFEEGDEINKSF